MAVQFFGRFFAVAALTSTVALGGCVALKDTHGYVPVEADITAISENGATRATVLGLLGEPTTTAVDGSSSWYYVSYVEERIAFFAPKITSREILAVRFDARDNVAGVDRYGLEDGMVINLATGETPTGGRELTLLQQILGNVGNFSAESFF